MIKIHTMRSFFNGDHQISTEALAKMAHDANEEWAVRAARIKAVFERENECRRIQGLAPLKRVLARHVKEAVAGGR